MSTYIAEIAGKDSVSAVHKFMREHNVDCIVPTIVLTGTEYGDLSSYDKSILYLANYAKELGIEMECPVKLHNEE